VLGHDAATGADLPPPPIAGLTGEARDAIRLDPATYGFHATVKAPFRLAENRTEGELVAALEAFVAGRRAFAIPRLILERFPSYVALVPEGRPAALHAFADEVVGAFEPSRAALTAEEVARRKPERLSPRQRDYLDRFGYPFVFEEFQAHFSLAGPMDPATRDLVAEALAADLPAAGPLDDVPMPGLALFRQPAPGARFRVIAHPRFPG
jgi:hypothetical protein